MIFDGANVTINLTSPGFVNIVTGVGQCVIDALEQTPAGVPCRQCLLLPTDTIPMDNCGCGPGSECTGQVALSIRGVYGSDQFPAPASGKAWTQCTPRYQVVRASVQVTRCVPTIDETGQAPECADELAAAVTLENDRTAIRQAIACCLDYAFHNQQPHVGTWLMNESLTIGELGGCAGVLTEFLVGVQACPCPG